MNIECSNTLALCVSYMYKDKQQWLNLLSSNYASTSPVKYI